MEINELYQRKGKNGVIDILLAMKKVVLDNDKWDKERITKETAKNITKDREPRDEIGIISDIFHWVKTNVKYYRDIKGKEEITYPYLILQAIRDNRNFYSSDCDDIAVLLSALLRSIGFRTRLEVVALRIPQYNHARCSVYSETLNKWLTLEGTSKSSKVGDAFPSRLAILMVEVS